MKTYAIIDTASGNVINTIQYEAQPSQPPPGFGKNIISVQSDVADTTWTWNGSVLVEPVIVQKQPDYRVLALAELDVTDMTALRCFKAGVTFPSEWQTYTTSIRAIVKSGTGPLPARPAYPIGT